MAITAEMRTSVLELYTAYFNRPADKAGVDYWLNDMDVNGLTLDEVSASFASDAQPEYVALYGGKTNAEIVISVYNNVLGRTVDETDEGAEYWIGELDSGVTPVTNLIQAVVNAAKEDIDNLGDDDVIANKTTVSQYAYDNDLSEEDAKTISLDTVTAASSSIDTAQSAIDSAIESSSIDGETFALTTSNDEIINGTAANDLFTASLGTLHAGDIIQDLSTGDADILNAAINSNDLATRIQNVETVNLTGEYVKTGIALTNVSGVKDLNLDTKIAGGVATVTAASSLNAENINAGSKIGTVNVTSLTSGTRDAVNVDAGSAKTISITGAEAGADNYNLTIADGATLTLVNTTVGTTNELNSAGDQVTINATGEIDLVSNQDDASTTTTMDQELALTVNATDDLQVNLSGATSSLVGKSVTLSGAGDVTLVSADGLDISGTLTAATGTTASSHVYDGVSITDAGTGVSTLEVQSVTSVTTYDFSKAVVDTIALTGGTGTAALAGAATMAINQDTTVSVQNDLNAALTVSVDNGIADTDFTTGTLMVEFAEAQGTASELTYDGSDVDTVLVSAKADEVTDYDADENGFEEVSSMTIDQITMASFSDGTTDFNSQVLVLQGDEAMTIGTVSMTGTQTISAGSLGEGVTISAITAANTSDDLTIVGSGFNDSVTTSSTAIYDIQGDAGNDKITVTNAKDGTEISGGTGDDTISAAASTTGETIVINAGAGDDVVTANADNTITLGDGADTVKLTTASLTANVVTDFVLGTDKVVLSGATATAAIDLSNTTPAADGTYSFGGKYDVVLKNGGAALSTKDVRDSVQLTNTTLVKNTSNKLGDLDDTVIVSATDTTGTTITTGAGNDTVTVAASADARAIIKDFTVGEDKIVLTGAIATATDVNLKNVTDTSGVYLVGATGTGAEFKLENGGTDISTDNDLEASVQLGASATDTFEVAGGNTTNITVSGGDFNDFVTVVAGAGATGTGTATYNFKDNGGVDTVVMATPSLSATGQEFVDFNALTGIDTVTDAANSKVDVAAGDAKVSDAKDGAVYVFADSAAGTDNAEITTFLTHTANGYTQDVINDEIAAFLNAGLGIQDGETYVAIINDTSSDDYAAATGGGADSNQYGYEAYAYLIQGDADGIQADDITLIGMIDDGTSGNAGGAGSAAAYVDATIVA